MKKTITLLTIMISVLGFSQETIFSMNEKAFTDYVVIQKEGMNSSELYTKTLEWINRTYKNPDKVILGKIENEYIRFEGSKNPIICKKVLGRNFCEEGRYQIEVSFKDGKYKFDVITVESYAEAGEFTSGGWISFNMKDTSFYYNKAGKIKSYYKNFPIDFPLLFNRLNESLSNYISGTNIESSKDW